MDPFVGEIQAFAFNYPPAGWAVCDGSLIAIRSNTALFSLIGTYYGGDGSTTFALPNLMGQVAVGQGQGPGLPTYYIGQALGETAVTLSSQEMPMHTHGMQLGAASSPNATAGPSAQSNVLIDPTFNGWAPPPGNAIFAQNAIALAGSSQPHQNMQPTLALLYCIALVGNFPSFS